MQGCHRQLKRDFGVIDWEDGYLHLIRRFMRAAEHMIILIFQPNNAPPDCNLTCQNTTEGLQWFAFRLQVVVRIPAWTSATEHFGEKSSHELIQSTSQPQP
jgi:hypothetical protein